MRTWLLVAFTFIFFGTRAVFAGILVDPYIGYGSYTTTYDTASLDDDVESYSMIGSRLGYSFLLLSAGIDYEMDNFSDGKRTNTSVFVGVDLPILLRFWGEYIFNSNLEIDDATYDIAFKNGYSLGVGFTGLPLVSLNLEVEKSSYKFEDVPLLGDFDTDWASYIFSVSFPLDF